MRGEQGEVQTCNIVIMSLWPDEQFTNTISKNADRYQRLRTRRMPHEKSVVGVQLGLVPSDDGGRNGRPGAGSCRAVAEVKHNEA